LSRWFLFVFILQCLLSQIGLVKLTSLTPQFFATLLSGGLAGGIFTFPRVLTYSVATTALELFKSLGEKQRIVAFGETDVFANVDFPDKLTARRKRETAT
jgi:hypothetical protein